MKFWKDRWREDMSLDASYPSLFSITTAKEAWVGDLRSMEHGSSWWNPTFSCPFNYWEMEDIEKILSQIGDKRIIEGMEETIQQMGTKNRLFSV